MHRLEVSHCDFNLLTEITENTFGSLDFIVNLSLSNNLITHLAYGAFNMTSLRTLKLSSNYINDLNSVLNLHNLRTLELSYNLIAKPINMIIFDNMKNLQNLNMNHNFISSVFGTSKTLFQRLEKLTFENNKIDLLPIDLLTNCKETFEILHMGKNHLHSMGYLPPSLVYLILPFNQITHLDWLRGEYKSLIYLDLRGNFIHEADIVIRKSIQTIHLSFNLISSFYFVPNIYEKFDPDGKLIDREPYYCKDLGLAHNNLDSVKNISGVPFYQVRMLTLHHNKLTSLDDDDLSSFKYKLDYLTLNHNRLTRLGNPFAHMYVLRFLRLDNNKLSKLNNTIFVALSLLQTLTLQENQIRSLSTNLFENLVSLTYLDVSSNFIKSLKFETFSTLNSLKALNLSNNGLEYLPRGMLDGTRLLSVLALADNNLTQVPDILLHFTPHLISLDLSGNQLLSLPSNIFMLTGKLEWLNLRDNSLDALPTLISLMSLKVLDAGFNFIKNIVV